MFSRCVRGSLGDPEAPGDLDVRVPGGNQPQQVFLPGCELSAGIAAPLGVQVGPGRVRAQQREHFSVTFGEVRSSPTEKEHPGRPAEPRSQPRWIGQEQLELMLDPCGR
jgi:hypothetical protein